MTGSEGFSSREISGLRVSKSGRIIGGRVKTGCMCQSPKTLYQVSVVLNKFWDLQIVDHTSRYDEERYVNYRA